MSVTETVYPTGTGITSSPTSPATTTGVVVAAGDQLDVHVTVDAGSDVGIVLACTANGVAPDSSQIVHANNSTAGFEQVFHWSSPPVGTYSVVTTITSGAGAQNALGQKVHVVHGTNGSAPATATPTFGQSTTASITSPSIPSGGMGISFLQAGSSFSGTNQTTDCNAANGGSAGGGFQAGSTSTATGAQSFTGSISATDFWGAIVNVYSPAASGPAALLLAEDGSALLSEAGANLTTE